MVHAALTMIITGDLNPHNFQYPSLNIYLQALLFFVLQLPATLFGVQLFPSQLIDFHVYARIMNVIFSTATIYAVYEIGRRLFNVWTGLAAMCFLTASSLHVENSYYATVDTTTAFWPTIACLMAVMIYTKNNGRKTSYYIVGGVCVGLAVSSKYTAFLAFLPILLAHVYRARKNKTGSTRILFQACWQFPSAFITTPYALLDYNTFLMACFPK
jgi:4-amino-4-deoxy-L-arabinose transferase-like glycosyltransferase